MNASNRFGFRPQKKAVFTRLPYAPLRDKWGKGVYVTGDIDTEAITRMNGNRPRVEETEEDSSRLALPNLS